MRSHLTSRYFVFALVAVLAGSLLSAGLPVFQPSYASHNNIEVDTDKIEYGQGDDVVISGSVEDVNDNDDTVDIRVTKAGGGSNTYEAEINNSGNFDYVYGLANSAADGIYTVRITYDSETVYTYFLVDEDDDDVTVVLDEESYEAGADVEIQGQVDGVSGVNEVEIVILDPTNDEALDDEEDIDSGDEFERTFELANDADHGRYAVTVTYNNDDQGFAIFEVEEDDTEPITVQLSKTTYTPGSSVRITGEVADVQSNEDVEVVVEDPDGAEVFEDNVEPDNDGSFEFEFDLEDDAETGTYTVTVTYDNDDKEATFTVSTGTSSGGSSGSSSGLTVVLNKASYLAGESMTITGKVPKLVNDAIINIDVFRPDGTFASIFTTAEPNSDLTYSATLRLKSDLDVDQDYKVKVNYDTYAGEKTFAITGASSSGSGGAITVKTDKSEYEVGATVRITGGIAADSLVEGQKVLIQVKKPDGNPYRIDIIDPSSSGSYSYSVVIGGALATIGEYEVVAVYGNNDVTAEFELVGGPGDKPKYNLEVEGENYPIEYELSGGSINNMFIRPAENKLVVLLDAEDDGQLTVVLPREIIDAIEDGQDIDYVVTIENESGDVTTIDVEESENTDDARTLVIDYEAGAGRIEITGTTVVPEFGAVSAIVLAVAIVGIIVATARAQKFSFFK